MSQAFFVFMLMSVVTLPLSQCQNFLIFNTTPAPGSGGGGRPTAAVPAQPGDESVLVNNRRVVATMPPFVQQPPPTQQFLNCVGSCPTTSEYNPICGSNQQLYINEQKFNCARRCGADIQIVRRGSCEGLFQMQRG